MRYFLLFLLLFPVSAQAANLTWHQKLENRIWVFEWDIRPTRVAQQVPYSNQIFDCSQNELPCAKSEEEAQDMARADAEAHEKK